MAKEKRIVILSVRVDETLASAIRELADADSRPISNYIEVLLRKHVADKGLNVGKSKRGTK
jgi:hypothetical protein